MPTADSKLITHLFFEKERAVVEWSLHGRCRLFVALDAGLCGWHCRFAPCRLSFKLVQTGGLLGTGSYAYERNSLTKMC